MPPEILGPTGLLVAALLAIAFLVRVILSVLWPEHLRADADDRAQRDTAIAGWTSATSGLARLAEAWEQRNREDAIRHRADDR